MRNSGIVRHSHWLGYGLDHGFGQWMPYRLQRIIVTIWNVASCHLMGHDTLLQERQGGVVECVSCGRIVTDPGEDVLRCWDESFWEPKP